MAQDRPTDVIANEQEIMAGIAGNDGANAKIGAEQDDQGHWTYTAKCMIHQVSPGEPFATRGHQNTQACITAWRKHATDMH